METLHSVPGGGMPDVRGRWDRPLQMVEEGELFETAFPGDGEPMRRVARGEGPRDGGRELRWEAVLELARRALSVPVARPEPFRSAAEVFERYRYRFASLPVEVFLAVLVD